MDDRGDSILALEPPYFGFIREERYFCAVLTHLLMQSAENVRSLITLVDEQLRKTDLSPLGPLHEVDFETAEIYVEFAFLRDRWNQFNLDQRESRDTRNANKRAFLFKLLGRAQGLAALQATSFPADVPQFNAQFMGRAGLRITQDIASPALWPVTALCDLARRVAAGEDLQKRIFRDLCRFKWAFRIKPDMVIVIPGMRPLCIEAKLMSPEGHYPTHPDETRIFDKLFQPPAHRVRQVELQDFLFRTLLGAPAQLVLLSQTHGVMTTPADGDHDLRIPALSWRQVFDRLNHTHSLPSVSAFLRENAHIQDSPLFDPDDGVAPPGRYFEGTANGLDAVLALIAERQSQHLSTEIGFDGGPSLLRQRTRESLAGRRWKWRDPDRGAGRRGGTNWIVASEFEQIVEGLPRESSED